jgi:exopolyphosphatase/guanosine-5'-triphosphate,3'-diphosphate pyrophosphatase
VKGAVEPKVGVLDVGSTSAHLVVVDRHGSPRDPVLTHKTRLRLDRALDHRGRLSRTGIQAISSAVAEANKVAEESGVREIYPLATSSIRDAANARDVVRAVAKATGTRLRFLSGAREAELAFLAARRWYGAAAGSLLVLDIGGGTLELAAGRGQHAEFARSLRLGAREVTRKRLGGDPVGTDRIAAARAYALERVRAALADVPHVVGDATQVGCSKVFSQLAKLAAKSAGRPTDELTLGDLREWIPRLAALPPARRAELPGISHGRAAQILAGAIVAEALLTVCAGRVSICPWSTRDGLLLTLQAGGPAAYEAA